MGITLNRWLVAVNCTLLMVSLGTVYAWSFFQKPLCDTYHWTNSEVAWAFSLAICFLGLAAAAGGILLPKTGPTRLALLGGVLFGSGYLLAAFALSKADPTLTKEEPWPVTAPPSLLPAQFSTA